MKHSFKNGAIIAEGQYFEEVNYNISNNHISVSLDGKGAIKSYSEANEKEFITNGFCAIHENNKHIDITSKKKVTMIGRKQIIEIELQNKKKLTITQILDENTNGLVLIYKLMRDDNKLQNVEEYNKENIELSLMFNNISNSMILSNEKIRRVTDNSGIIIKLEKLNTDYKVFISFSKENINNILEKMNKLRVESNHLTREINTFISEIENNNEEELNKVLNNIEQYKNKWTELEKAVYMNTYFCALENYKEKDDYKSFMAGCKYLLPMRSYYRDSYWTILPMFNGQTDKIRNQIITLAKGITESGECPSAVKYDYSPWWIGHYDSPSFFVLMLNDYVECTKDKQILHFVVDDDTILEKAIQVMNRLAYKEGKNGLLYKTGNYNKCDWADEVNRNGYVTYNNILYARAYQCMINLCRIVDGGTGERVNYFLQKYYKLVNLINTELWSNDLGYYINYKYQKSDETWFIEDNLSIDTVLAVLWGIAEENQSIRILRNMESILECKNNKDMKANGVDFGVMCIYPPYKNIDSAYNKSSQPFNYHNGANWPYLTAIYALAKRKYSMEYRNILTDWFIQNIEKGNYTPVEYYSDYCKDGSLLQAWCGTVAFVMDRELSENLW